MFQTFLHLSNTAQSQQFILKQVSCQPIRKKLSKLLLNENTHQKFEYQFQLITRLPQNNIQLVSRTSPPILWTSEFELTATPHQRPQKTSLQCIYFSNFQNVCFERKLKFIYYIQTINNT